MQLIENMFKNFQYPFRNRIACVYQGQESECALACLAMLTNYFGINCTLNDLHTIYSSTRGGLNVSQLVALSQTVGIRLIPHHISNIDDLHELHCPAIALLDESHFIVIANVDDFNLSILDPLLGSVQLRLDQLNHSRFSIALEARAFSGQTIKNVSREVLFLTQLKVSLFNLRPIFLLAVITLILITSIFQLSSAQIQNVFFEWILAMNMKQWSIPLGYTQIAVGFVAALSALLLSLLIAKKYAQLSFRWNQHIYRRLLRLPESFFLNRSSGDIIAKFDNLDDILAVSQSSIVTLGISILNIFILLSLLATSSVGLLLIAVITVVLLLGALYAFLPFTANLQHQVQQSQAESSKTLFEIFSNYEQIRMEGRENYFIQEYTFYQSLYFSNSTRLSLRFSQQEFILSTLDSLSSVLLLVGSAFVIYQGNMTLGQYAALDVLIGISISPLASLSGVVQTLQQTGVAFARLKDLTVQPLDARYQPDLDISIKSNTDSPVVDIQNVDFKYSLYGTKVFNNLSLSLNSSDFPVLVQAPHSSGKSTFARLLAGRLRSNSGTIRISGVNPLELCSRSRNELVLICDGNPLIISGSIMANLRHGSSASVEDVVLLLENLGLKSYSFFTNTSRQIGYFSNVELSGGELALMHLCRCLLIKPKMIVFDDILSALPQQAHAQIIRIAQQHIQYALFISSSFSVPDDYTVLTLASEQ